jgi:putative ABC transport system permease protein
VLADPAPGLSAEEVCRRIDAQTNLRALTRQEFSAKTILYFLKNTGIPMNFGITVLLGFFVGTAIAGQTFYLFTLENLKQFGALKAMGASNLTLTWMVLLQAAVVGSIGYGLGVGGAALFGELTKAQSKLAFLMPWWILAGTGVAVVVISMLASLLSIRKLIVLEPAIVFQG